MAKFKSWFPMILCCVVLAVISDTSTELAETNTPRLQLTKEQDHTIQDPQGHNICTTQACNSTADWIIEAMDQSVDPCHDFYRFACGNFEDKGMSPDFTIIDHNIRIELKWSIKNDITPTDNRTTFSAISKYYTACVGDVQLRAKKKKYEENKQTWYKVFPNLWSDWSTEDEKKWSEASSMENLKKILAEFGGWPVLDGDKWRKNNFNWEETVYRSRRMGYHPDFFFFIAIGPDYKNWTKNVIYLGPLHKGLLSRPPRELSDGLSNNKVTEFVRFMVEIAVRLGLDRTQAEKIMPESLRFEMDLAKILLSAEELQNKTVPYKLTTVRELMVEYPSIPWLGYIGTILAPVVNITDMEPVYVVNSPYFSELVKLLNQTSKPSLANYMMWRVVRESIGSFLYEVKEMQQDIYGVLKQEREEQCFNMVFYDLPLGLASLYIKKHFNGDTIGHAEKIALQIRERFGIILQNSNWTDKGLTTVALKKLETVAMVMGYPDGLADDSKVDTFHEKLNLSTTDSFLEIRRKCHLVNWENSTAKLRNLANEIDWIDYYSRDFLKETHYSESKNQITVAVGYLQDPYFNHDRPCYVNYGVTGYTIGHEIAHSLSHRWYERESNNPKGSWSNETKLRYLDRVQCSIDQANNYTLRGTSLKINGTSVLDENLADYEGLKMAYLTYRDWKNDQVPEPRLVGLQNYTSQQMFWISYARSQCANGIFDGALKDEHSPSQFRVNGPISNIPEFASDFKCSSNSDMNPLNKCCLW